MPVLRLRDPRGRRPDRRGPGRTTAASAPATTTTRSTSRAEFDRPFASFGTWRGVDADARARASRDGARRQRRLRSPSTRPAPTSGDDQGRPLLHRRRRRARPTSPAETGDGFDFDATRAALRATAGRPSSTQATIDRRHARPAGRLLHRALPLAAAPEPGRRRRRLATSASTARCTRRSGLHAVRRTSRCGTPTARRTSCSSCSRPTSPATSRCRCWRSAARAAGCRAGRWPNSETNIMTGDPVTPFLVEAWSKGLLAGHEAGGVRAAAQNATEQPPADSPYNGRAGQSTAYAKRGYIPSGLRLGTDCVDKGGDNDCEHPASATLEYAAADAALSLMAAGLGHDRRRARCSPSAASGTATSGTPRSSSSARAWPTAPGSTPYDPVERRRRSSTRAAPTSTSGWCRRTRPGWSALLGGRAATEKRLDDFFAYAKLLTDPAGTARTDWIDAPYDYYAQADLQPEQRARPARAVHVPLGRAAGEDRDRGARRVRRCSPPAPTA